VRNVFTEWYHSRVGNSACVPSLASAVPVATVSARRSVLVRITYWITAHRFLALVVSGVEIVISHPCLYLGKTRNMSTPPLFKLPTPASRNLVSTGYGYVLPDQNGWSRYLHFQSASIVVLTGLSYLIASLVTGHFRKGFGKGPGSADPEGGCAWYAGI